MSITKETAKAHENDPAVLCCRFEAGTVIEPSNLEDPAIFPDLVDSGLLEIGEDTLKIGEVLGAKLTKTSDALTPLTKDLLEGVAASSSEPVEEIKAEEVKTETATLQITSGDDIKSRPSSREYLLSPAKAGMAGEICAYQREDQSAEVIQIALLHIPVRFAELRITIHQVFLHVGAHLNHSAQRCIRLGRLT